MLQFIGKFNQKTEGFQYMKFNITRNFIMVAIFALLMQKSAMAKNLKFVQITDSHVSISDMFSTRDTDNSVNVLKKTVEDINSIPNIDFVIFTGDNIDHSNETDLKAFLKITNKLNKKYYMVIGNHEVFKSQKFSKKDYMRVVRRYSKGYHPWGANYVFKQKGIVFIVVDGAKEVIPGPAGYFKKQTLAWLDKKLTKYAKKDVIIVQHFPIEPPYRNKSHATYNVQEYKDLLAKHHNVISVISGHYHANGEKMVDGIYHISTPALVEKPHNYKIIEVEYEKGKPMIYTQLRHAEF